jgi:hypothetical protein
MKKPSYKKALEWIVFNDMPEDLRDVGHISSCFVADMFEVPIEKVLSDVFRIKSHQIKERF